MAEKEKKTYAGPDILPEGRMMTKEEIRARFNAGVAEAYAAQKPVWLPEYGDVFALMADMLKRTMPLDARIIDLGAGTGNLAKLVLETLPDAHVHLIDFSPDMLAAVPDTLREFEGRFSVEEADIFTCEFGTEPCDAVVSSFALHHARGPETYRSVYRRAAAALHDNGLFLCADVVEGDSLFISDQNEALWRRYLAGHFDAEQIETIMKNYKTEDSPISLKTHLALLMDAGFTACDVLWKKYNFAVYVGAREKAVFRS